MQEPHQNSRFAAGRLSRHAGDRRRRPRRRAHAYGATLGKRGWCMDRHGLPRRHRIPGGRRDERGAGALGLTILPTERRARPPSSVGMTARTLCRRQSLRTARPSPNHLPGRHTIYSAKPKASCAKRRPRRSSWRAFAPRRRRTCARPRRGPTRHKPRDAASRLPAPICWLRKSVDPANRGESRVEKRRGGERHGEETLTGGFRRRPMPQCTPWLRFLFSLIERNVQISRIALSDWLHPNAHDARS